MDDVGFEVRKRFVELLNSRTKYRSIAFIHVFTTLYLPDVSFEDCMIARYKHLMMFTFV